MRARDSPLVAPENKHRRRRWSAILMALSSLVFIPSAIQTVLRSRSFTSKMNLPVKRVETIGKDSPFCFSPSRGSNGYRTAGRLTSPGRLLIRFWGLRLAELLFGAALQLLGLAFGLGRALAGPLAGRLSGLTLGPVDRAFHFRVRHLLPPLVDDRL